MLSFDRASEAAAPIAAIIHDGKGRADAFMVDVVRRLRAEHWRLGGVVQHNIEKQANVCAAMEAEELASGRHVTISLPPAPGARGCRLDPAGLAEAAALAAPAIVKGIDLVVISKFGRQEAEGRGLRAEMGLAVERGLPLLTSVPTSLRSEWTAFAGEAWRELPPDAEAVLDWCRALRTAHDAHLRRRAAKADAG